MSDVTRPAGEPILVITFLYYRDIHAAQAWYEDVMGFTLAIDQGWAKIMHIGGGAHVGLVDESKGMNSWQEEKCIQLCVRVPDVDAWYDYAKAKGVANLSELFINDEIGIRAFVFDDPEGYQVELQTATRPGA